MKKSAKKNTPKRHKRNSITLHNLKSVKISRKANGQVVVRAVRKKSRKRK